MLRIDQNSKSWRPDPNSYNDVLINMTNLFEDLDPSLLADYAAISVFLMDKNAVIEQIKKISTLIEDKVKNEYFSIQAEKKSTYTISLKKFIMQELAQFGFQPQYCKSRGFIDSLSFFKAIKNKFVIKDSAEGIFHGEFSHPLQWLLIAMQNKESNFLTHPVIDLYTKSDAPSNKKIGDAIWYLWDEIVDQLEPSDFRKPEYFYEFLLDPLEEINELDNSLIIALLKELRLKRILQQKHPKERDDLYNDKYEIETDELLFPLNWRNF